MLEMGVVVALGLLVVLAKCPWRMKMRIISNPVTTDLVVMGILLILHWGTFSGVMVATVGALFCSVTLSIAKFLVGSVVDGRYVPGRLDISSKL